MPVTDEPHSAREEEKEQRDRKRDRGGVGESRGHVNRYMLETGRVFIHAVMQREMGEVMERGIKSITTPEC